MSDTESIPAPLKATPVQDLFFQDGNIVLQAEKTLFRLYKGFLASKSTVFRDMLAFPQPEGRGRTLLGCPVVEMYDNSEDATHFLRALSDPSYLLPGKPTSFAEVAAVLRLANKYDTPFLVERAVAHVASVYPPTLAGWARRNEERTVRRAPYLCVAVLQLAREQPAALTCVLPQVLYACADGLSVAEIFDGVDFCYGVASEDGVRADEEESAEAGRGKGVRRVVLCPADQRAVLRGREELLQAKRVRLYAFLTSLSAGCGGHACREEKLKCFAKVQWDAAVFDSAEDFDWRCFEQRVCKRCFSEGRAAHDIALEGLWNELPRFFDLPKWEALWRAQ
ncbi:hypothetical protein HDZ31DRAFT_65796 [Schizophyllum fasciatum]